MTQTDLVPLKAVSRHFASKPKYLTVLRWTTEGLLCANGTRVLLQTEKEGGRVFVSLEAIADFKAALNSD